MRRWRRSPAEAERGAAVVDFVLVCLVLVPLFLGLVQVGLVLYVRSTVASAASQGAQYGARVDRGPADGVARTRSQLAGALSDRFASAVTGRDLVQDGVRVVEVRVRVAVPPLGLWGPAVEFDVTGHGIREQAP